MVASIAIQVLIKKKFKLPSKRSKELLPYKSRNKLFTQAEISFLGILDNIIKDDQRVFGKIRLADIIEVKNSKVKNNSDWQRYFNYISSKHLDFLICRKADLSILYAIELDDKSHDKKSRQERDRFLNEAMESAGIPLVRIKIQRLYNRERIKSRLPC